MTEMHGLDPPDPWHSWLVVWRTGIGCARDRGAEIRPLNIAPPAPQEALDNVERRIGRPIPESLRRSLAMFSSNFYFRWFPVSWLGSSGPVHSALMLIACSASLPVNAVAMSSMRRTAPPMWKTIV